MHEHAKLFQTGGSQAVRLPKAFRFEGQGEVRISREGDRVILEPVKKGWSPGFLALIGSAPDLEIPPEPSGLDDAPDFA